MVGVGIASVRRLAKISYVSPIHRTLTDVLYVSGLPHCRQYSTASDDKHLIVNEEAGLGKITINRPKALNAKNCGALMLLCQLRQLHRLSHDQ